MLWFCFVIGLKKLAPPTQPIRTNHGLVARVFPRLALVTCICFEFLLVHCVVYVCCDWPFNCFDFDLTTLNWKPLYWSVGRSVGVRSFSVDPSCIFARFLNQTHVCCCLCSVSPQFSNHVTFVWYNRFDSVLVDCVQRYPRSPGLRSQLRWFPARNQAGNGFYCILPSLLEKL